MDKVTLRRLALEVLLRTPNTDFQSLTNAVAELATEHQLLGPDRTIGPGTYSLSDPQLSLGDQTTLQEVVWDLIVERVVTPGADGYNPEWPWLRLTEGGKRIANEELGRSA
jgi:hypothetical protein